MSKEIQQNPEAQESEELKLIKGTITVTSLLDYCKIETNRDARLYEYNKFMNRNPHKSWQREYTALSKPNKPYMYIPIGITEGLLTFFFGEWRFDITSISQLADSATVIGRLHYFDRFVDNKWKYVDGCAACSLQKEKGNGEFKDYAFGAAQKAVPSAKSFALKDATDGLGSVFGANLTRQHTLDFFAAPSNIPSTQPSNNLLNNL